MNIQSHTSGIIDSFLSPGANVARGQTLAQVLDPYDGSVREQLTAPTDGLLYTQRTSGRFITNDEAAIKKLREQLAEDQAKNFINKMKLLGYSADEAAEFLKNYK